MDTIAYLHRLAYSGKHDPTLETLQALHQAHLLAVPFENLDMHRGRPMRLESTALFHKVVVERRGGLCYELNGLFAALLRELGFRVTLLSASMAHASGGFGPEIDHPTILVHLCDEWLADVGNGDSFLQPLKIQDAVEHVEGEQAYRLQRDGEHWMVQRRRGSDPWRPEYRFGLAPHVLADFADRCQYYQYSPLSPFTQSRVCSRATPEGRITLRDQRLITTSGGKQYERLLVDQQDDEQVLAHSFGIVLA